MSVSNDTKHSATLSNQAIGGANLTWDEATFSWDNASGTWDKQYASFTNQTKNSGTLSNQAKS